jgi:hypothetical protein
MDFLYFKIHSGNQNISLSSFSFCDSTHKIYFFSLQFQKFPSTKHNTKIIKKKLFKNPVFPPDKKNFSQVFRDRSFTLERLETRKRIKIQNR